MSSTSEAKALEFLIQLMAKRLGRLPTTDEVMSAIYEKETYDGYP